MSQIGLFTRVPEGLRGRLRTLRLDLVLTLVALEPGPTRQSPDYRIHLGEEPGGPHVGAAWRHSGAAGEVISVALDDPSLPQPIRANLFAMDPQGERYRLVWSRRDHKVRQP